MNETTTFLGTTGTTNTYSGNLYATPLSGGSGTTIYTDNTILSTGVTLSQAISNSNNMNKQVKVAVFTVERNEDNKVISSKFVNELWVEIKNGASLELSVAKQLDKDFDPSTTVIREIASFTF
jgi:hypothetical protein